MPLSWNEINKRAIEFSNEWKDVNCERSESKSFWDSFFNIVADTCLPIQGTTLYHSEKNVKLVEQAARRVLDARKDFPDSSLADLYDPLSTPPALLKAHKELDKAVDLCYRPQAFTDEMRRIEYLFDLYQKYIEPLLKKKKMSRLII